MKGRALPLLTVIFGLATLAVFLALGSQPVVRAVYPAMEISAAVSEFQRAETPDHVLDVLGRPPAPGRIAAMDALNTLDLYGFIPAYTLFLCAAAIMLGGLRNRWAQAAIVLAVLGAAADAVETSKQLQLTADIENMQAHLPIATWHWIKYALLGLQGVAVAGLCLTAQRKRWILGVIALLTLPFVALAYLDVITPRAFAATLSLYMISLLIVAITELVRGKGSQP